MNTAVGVGCDPNETNRSGDDDWPGEKETDTAIEKEAAKMMEAGIGSESKEEALPNKTENFYLAGLDPMLLEKVITKVCFLRFLSTELFQMNPIAYCRLQQACRGMYELVRKCRKMFVYRMDGNLYHWRSGSWTYCSEGKRLKGGKSISIDAAYGLCFKYLSIGNNHLTVYILFNILGNDIPFDDLFPIMEKNRIVCDELSLPEFSRYTIDQYATLLKILKPVKFSMCCDAEEDKDLYKGILGSKYLVRYSSLFVFFLSSF